MTPTPTIVTLEGGVLDGTEIETTSPRICCPLVSEQGFIYSVLYERRHADAVAKLHHFQWLDVCPTCHGERTVERRRRDGTGKLKQRKCLDGLGSVSVRSVGAPGSGEPVERERYDA